MKQSIFAVSLLAVTPATFCMTYTTAHKQSSSHGSIICHTADNTHVASAAFHITANGHDAILRSIVVAPTYRNQGIGSRLLLKTCSYLQSLRVQTVNVEAVGSKHFFLKHGAQEQEQNELQMLTDTIPLTFDLAHMKTDAAKDTQ